MRRKWEDAVSGKQQDIFQKEILVVSGTDPTVARKQAQSLSASKKGGPRRTKENPEWFWSHRRDFQETRPEIVQNCLERKCMEPLCNARHPPVCLNYKSES